MAPNFHYFPLYDLPDSPCDMLGLDSPITSAPDPLHLQPNPAPDEVLVRHLRAEVSANGLSANMGCKSRETFV